MSIVIRNTSEVTLEQLLKMQQNGIKTIVVKDKDIHEEYGMYKETEKIVRERKTINDAVLKKRQDRKTLEDEEIR